MERRGTNGQAFLGLVILIGAVVAIVGILVAFLANSYIDTGYGASAAAMADSVANSGVQDVVMQIERSGLVAPLTTYTCPTAYTLPVGSSTAAICITQSLPNVTVLSVATVAMHTRKVSAVLLVNASTSQVSVVSSQDVQ